LKAVLHGTPNFCHAAQRKINIIYPSGESSYTNTNTNLDTNANRLSTTNKKKG